MLITKHDNMVLQRLLLVSFIFCFTFMAECTAQNYTPPIPGHPRIVKPVVMKVNFDTLFKVNGNQISSSWDIAVFRKRYYKPKNVVIVDDKGINITSWKGKNLDVLRIVNGFQILGLSNSKG